MFRGMFYSCQVCTKKTALQNGCMVGQNVALHPHILSSVTCVVTAMKYTALLKQHTAGSNAATHTLGQYASLNKKIVRALAISCIQ
jgi:hypothetical protein